MTVSGRTTLLASKEAQLSKLRQQQQDVIAKAAAEKAAAIAPKPFNTKGGLIYNVASVKQAYLNPGETAPSKDSLQLTNFNTFTSGDGNFPKKVQEAVELWKNSSNHKGMISAWKPPAGIPNIDPLTVSGTSNSSGVGTFGKKDPNKYAFQFLYNPQPVNMGFKGAPPIDISQYTSGTEEYALWASGNGGGTISFDLLLMRMYDLPYYKSNGLKGYCTKPSIYAPGRVPAGEDNKGSLFNEQDVIYNKGTMYDIEFLLRTVLGITINSQLRGETADVGWIGALPVELHLGPGLRYWGTVSGLNVNHVIFNERMVPIFSTVHIEFNRLPDYNWQSPTVAIKTSSGGTRNVKQNKKGFGI
jgi:hypothetical protein